MNIKSTTRHNGRNELHLYFALEAYKSNFEVHNFEFIFLREQFLKFWELNKRCFQNDDTLCSQRYSRISILSEIVLLCCLCKNVCYILNETGHVLSEASLQQNAGVLHKMRVCHFEYVAGIFHVNALFCCYFDGCEAPKLAIN